MKRLIIFFAFFLFQLFAQDQNFFVDLDLVSQVMSDANLLQNNASFSAVRLPTGSDALLYKISTPHGQYVLRKVNKSSFDIKKEFYVAKYASDHSFGPEVFYVDEQNGIILMRYIESSSEEMSIMEKIKIGIVALKKLHKIDNVPFSTRSVKEKIVSELQLFDNDLGAGYKNEIMSLLLKIDEYLADMPKVLSHTDFHGNNILFTQDKAFLIDFESIEYECYLYDIATVFAEQEDIPDNIHLFLLQEYLMHEPDLSDWKCYWYCQALRMIKMAVMYLKRFEKEKVEHAIFKAKWYIDIAEANKI